VRGRLADTLPDLAAATKLLASKGDRMNALKIVGAALIVAGILGLVYGQFSYTKETHEAKLGPLELSLAEKETVNVPVWAGVAAIVAGGIVLLLPQKS
jgi:drug/metabolite transporter (DMT)-like permease